MTKKRPNYGPAVGGAFRWVEPYTTVQAIEWGAEFVDKMASHPGYLKAWYDAILRVELTDRSAYCTYLLFVRDMVLDEHGNMNQFFSICAFLDANAKGWELCSKWARSHIIRNNLTA